MPCTLTADAFGMFMCIANKPSNNVKPHLKTHRAPTAVVPPSTYPWNPQVAVDASENKILSSTQSSWAHTLSLDGGMLHGFLWQ